MVLGQRVAWRRGAGGGRCAHGGEGGRDARGVRASDRVAPHSGGSAGVARPAGGREGRLLRGHRRACLGRRRRARVQPHPRRHLEDLLGGRLTSLSAQHHAAASIHQAARR